MATVQVRKPAPKTNGRGAKSATPFPTKNDLPQRVRGEIIFVLQAQLADAIDLRMGRSWTTSKTLAFWGCPGGRTGHRRGDRTSRMRVGNR